MQILTPIVIASVLATVVQEHFGPYGLNPVFKQLNYQYLGAVEQLPGIIRHEVLRSVLDSDVAPQLLMASDIATDSPISIFPDDNLLEALRDFATPDVESLPVEERQGQSRRLV